MNRLDTAQIAEVAARHPAVFQVSSFRKYRSILAVGAVVLYCVYAWWFFSAGKVFSQANWGIAGSYLADWVTYEARPDIRFENGNLKIFFPNFGPYPDGFVPDWIKAETKTITRVEAGSAVDPSAALANKSANSFMAQGVPGTGVGAPAAGQPAAGDAKEITEEVATRVDVTMGGASTVSVVPGEVTVTHRGETVVLDVVDGVSVTPRGPLPQWAEQNETGGRVYFRFGFPGRVEVESREVEVRHRFWGWSNFWFDTNSPFWGKQHGRVLDAADQPASGSSRK